MSKQASSKADARLRGFMQKLFLSTFKRLLFSIIIPVLFFAIIVWFTAIQNLYHGIDENDANRRYLWKESIDNVTEEFNRISISLSTSSTITKRLKHVIINAEQGILAEDYAVFDSIYDMIIASFISNMAVDSLYIYFDGSDYFLSSDEGITNFRYSLDVKWFSIYDELPENTDTFVTLRSVSDSSQDIRMLSFFRRLTITGSPREQGVLVLNVPQQRMNRMLSDLCDKDPGYNLFVINGNGEVLYACDEMSSEQRSLFSSIAVANSEELFQGIEILAQEDKTTYHICAVPLSSNTTYLISVIDERILFAEPRKLTILLMIVLIVTLFACICYAYSRAASDRSSMRHIMETIDLAQEGQIIPSSPVRYGNAYSVLLQDVIHTFIQNDYLTIQLEERKQHERVLELMALRSQINPHFLFNTMDTIKWRAIALTGGENEASEMLESLADILRYSLRNSGGSVPLQEEIRMSGYYIDIQKIRHHGKIIYHESIPEELLGLRVMKLILQPLLENSITHVVNQIEGVTEISVQAQTVSNDLCITVSDNGPGIDPLNLEEIRSKLKRGYVMENKHIGLFNTNKRILLTFGDKYGIELYSDSRGTRSVIHLPIIHREEDFPAQRHLDFTIDKTSDP